MDKLTYQYLNDWISGDDRAFKQLFDHYLPKLIRFSFKSLKSMEDAEELSLNVMLNIWNYKSNLSTIINFEDYLYGILRNQISRHYRKKLLLTTELDLVPLQNLGSIDHPEFSMKELQQCYENALNKLPVKQREIFLMSREKGLSQKQIAEQKGLSVHTVNNHISTSLKFLRKEFIDYPEALSVVVFISTTTILTQ